MNIYHFIVRMKRDEIEQNKKICKINIDLFQKRLGELDTMTPDEDKPVTMSWYTVCFAEWVLHIDQWLDATTMDKALDSCSDRYDMSKWDILTFQAVTSQCNNNTLNNIFIEQNSLPF